MEGNESELALSVNALSRSFGHYQAVSNVSFTISPGRVFALLGPNGAGKTTTVRMITGLLFPDSGSVTIYGVDLARHPLEARRLLGVMGDDASLFKRITLWEHVIMTGQVFGFDMDTTTARAEELLRFLNLWKKRHVYAHEASHGMKKKVLVAMALIHQPRLLVLDEPFEGLDPVSVIRIRDLIRRLADAGRSVLITSHMLSYMEQVCDDIAVLNNGVLQGETTSAALVEQDRHLEDFYLEVTRLSQNQTGSLQWLQ